MKLNQYSKTALIGLAVGVSITGCGQDKVKEQQKPNIIYILADDLGYGDLSCYGQEHFSTPNIDKLAAKGMRFTQHYSGSTVCAPSRSALMTGQHTGHTYIRGNMERPPEGQHPLKGEAITMAELFKQAGYATGAFGKWGLGYPGSEGDPNNQDLIRFLATTVKCWGIIITPISCAPIRIASCWKPMPAIKPVFMHQS